MKHAKRTLWLIAVITIGFVLTGCKEPEGNNNTTTPKHTHSWGSGWSVTTPATCMAEGLQTRACTGCEETETEVIVIDPDAHDMRATANIRIAPTCEDDGIGETACAHGCGHTEAEGVIDALGHDPEQIDGAVSKEPTCAEEGIGIMECVRDECGHTEAGGVIDMLEHEWGGYVQITAPTCYAKGVNQRNCEDCNHADPVTVEGADMIAHTMTEDWHIVIPATCLATGSEEKHCRVSGCTHQIFQDVEIDLSDSGHDYQYIGQSVAPNCVDLGSGTATCAICDDERTQGSYATNPNNHKTLGTVFQTTVEPDCVLTGDSYLFCSACNTHDMFNPTSYLVVPALGHDWIDNWATTKAATCLANGDRERVCNRSGCIVKQPEIDSAAVPALGHEWVETNWVTTQLAVCTVNGDRKRECNRSDCTVEQTEIGSAALPSFGGHTFPATTPATCTAASVVFRCNRLLSGTACDHSNPETVVNALGHDWQYDEGATVATCTTPGSGARHCTRAGCTDKSTGGTYPALGHSYPNTIPATCIAVNITFPCTRVNGGTVCGIANPETIALNPANHAASCNFPTYTITGSGTQFSVNKGLCIPTVGTANQTIQNAVNAIRTHADGEAVTIQFGSGGDNVLDIGTASANFNNSGGTWTNPVTMTGRITSTNVTATQGTIVLADTVSINSTADISVTNNAGTTNSRAIRNGGTGTVNILGGTVSATGGAAVWNANTGTITVSSGTISATRSARAIYNEGNADVNILGGTVSAIDEWVVGAIFNGGTGTITISGENTVITSNASNNGTIYNDAAGAIVITGGTITNTRTSTENTTAIQNVGAGTVTISGGTVTGYRAIFNSGTGLISISGADTVITSANHSTSANSGTIVLANSGTETVARLVITGGTVRNTSNNVNVRAVYNDSTGAVNISGGTVGAMTAEGAATSGFAVWNDRGGEITINQPPAVIVGRTRLCSPAVNYHVAGCSPPSGTYVITGSGTEFSIGGTICIINMPIQNVINDIRGIANGSDATIQFGDGTTILNIDTGSASFNNTGGTWGNITLTGRITSRTMSSNAGTIALAGAVSLTSTANITNTYGATSGIAINNTGTGTLTINGGEVSGAGQAIQNSSTGIVIINGGTISGTGNIGRGILNNSTGTVHINGGTVRATGWYRGAILNEAGGTINISGTDTVITSAINAVDDGTVNNNASGSVTITGGTITNTTNGANANAILNAATGTVSLSNCTVQANAHADAHAIRNVTTDTSRIIFGAGVTILGNLMNCPELP